MDSFKKGEDFQRDMLWKDAEKEPMKPSDLVEYLIKVYSVDDNTEAVLEFASTPEGEQKPIEVVDDVAGKVRLRFDRNWSGEAEATNYFADVYWYYADAEGVDGKSLEIIERVELFKLTD